MADELTSRDIERMKAYIEDAERRINLGISISKDDFIRWVRKTAVWLVDRLEAAWNWIRGVLFG